MVQVRRVLALVRTQCFSDPLSECTDEVGIPYSNPLLAVRVVRVMGREILLLTMYFEYYVGFRRGINANLMHDVCFLTRGGKVLFILRADFNFPPSLWQDLCAAHGGCLWIQKLEHRWSLQWIPHTRAEQAGVKSLTLSIIFWCQRSFGL